jgi:hypothetical protein
MGWLLIGKSVICMRPKRLPEDLSGQKVISFRIPALRLNGETARVLIDVFPGLANAHSKLLQIEPSGTGKAVVFDIQPNEYISESDKLWKIVQHSKHPAAFTCRAG